MTIIEAISVTIAGMIGALLRDCLRDNSLVLPSIKNGKLNLGFMGGIIAGAVVGLILDGNMLTAFFAGYSGTSILQKILNQNQIQIEQREETRQKEAQITEEAKDIKDATGVK